MRNRSLVAGSAAAAAIALWTIVAGAGPAAAAPRHGAVSPAGGASAPHKLLAEVAGRVDQGELEATIKRLVGFGTRHTLSDTQSETRGIGAARRWAAKRFGEFAAACGGCLEIATPEEVFTGERVPNPTAIGDVIAIQRGVSDPDRVIIISGHIDSRASETLDATTDAPGADDDGSGTAAVIEAARILSHYKFPATLVYSVNAGEEQGLYGARVLAKFAESRHWRVEAVLNNDIVGNSRGANGVREDRYVRVFSEGTRSIETPDEANKRRYNGGELDSPSRNLARFIAGIGAQYLNGFQARMVYRTDRYGRGGDQTPMLAAGYPAVRLTEAIENYHREHQNVRVENGIAYGDVAEAIDFPYLTKVVRLNVASLAALAMAPAPPAEVTISGAVTLDTKIGWTATPGAAHYRIWWRDTTSPVWTDQREAQGDATSLTLENVNIDDFFFGVSAVSADGFESPVEFPGPAGTFLPPNLRK